MSTPLDDVLRRLSPEKGAQLLKWMRSRPASIRRVMERYPPGTTRMVQGERAYLVGYAEMKVGPPGFFYSFVDPVVNQPRAYATRFFICARCHEGSGSCGHNPPAE